ncbi:hypothetical protein TSUD_47850 [Trifolium subterraneum]|nr:hypothetical protein TSUD_47850 [Trifolium subterraneum]
MEAAQLISEWDSLSGQFTAEESVFMSHLSKQINYESIDKGSTLELVHAKNNLQAKREDDHEMMMVSEPSSEEDSSQNMENPAKRFRSSIEVSRNMRNVRKCPKSASMNNNEEGLQWHGFNNCFSQVDISTMLEEAVQYVKFLQLQIKVLSSDDMWMYAPIAYNGINIGLDLSFN